MRIGILFLYLFLIVFIHRRTSNVNGTTTTISTPNGGVLYRKSNDIRLQQQHQLNAAIQKQPTADLQPPASTADGIVRLPRGPDGSTGFLVRR